VALSIVKNGIKIEEKQIEERQIEEMLRDNVTASKL
jgi:hypothetical protein